MIDRRRDLQAAMRRHPAMGDIVTPPAWLRAHTVEQCARCHRLVGLGELVLSEGADVHCELCGRSVWAGWWGGEHAGPAAGSGSGCSRDAARRRRCAR